MILFKVEVNYRNDYISDITLSTTYFPLHLPLPPSGLKLISNDRDHGVDLLDAWLSDHHAG